MNSGNSWTNECFICIWNVVCVLPRNSHKTNFPRALLEVTSQIVWYVHACSAISWKSHDRLRKHWQLKGLLCAVHNSELIPSHAETSHTFKDYLVETIISCILRGILWVGGAAIHTFTYFVRISISFNYRGILCVGEAVIGSEMVGQRRWVGMYTVHPGVNAIAVWAWLWNLLSRAILNGPREQLSYLIGPPCSVQGRFIS